ncbi:MAG: Flp family type IVb pilin [Acidobacteria bacterium]|nr:Flp family type IVb pilin [Acidobacteriota bacterium]
MAIINNFLRDENGLEPSEYAIDVWLIAVAVIAAGATLGALIIGAIDNL